MRYEAAKNSRTDAARLSVRKLFPCHEVISVAFPVGYP